MPIRAVCFDAFGTLCRIAERRRPFEQLFTRLGVGLRVGATFAMTGDRGLEEIAEHFGDARAANGLQEELAEEVASVTLFEDALPALEALSRAGIGLQVVSNLASPYAAAVRRLLDGQVAGYSFSFAEGVMKPDPAIFAHACAGLSAPPDEVLMVGDSRRADVEGAEASGMRGVWLRRGLLCEWPSSVGSLDELVSRLTSR